MLKRITTLLASAMLLSPMSAVPLETSRQEVLTVVESYVKATDNRDSALLRKTLDKRASHFVSTPASNEPMVMGLDEYAALLEQGRIGGQERHLTINDVELLDDSAAFVSAEASTSKAVFHYSLVILKSADGAWRIFSIGVRLSVR